MYIYLKTEHNVEETPGSNVKISSSISRSVITDLTKASSKDNIFNKHEHLPLHWIDFPSHHLNQHLKILQQASLPQTATVKNR